MRVFLPFSLLLFLCTTALPTMLQAKQSSGSIATSAYSTEILQASFTASPTYLERNQVVTCTNTSTGAAEYTWIVDGIAQSTLSFFTPTFTTNGRHTITLVARNGNKTDTTYAVIHVGRCRGREANMWYFGNNSGLNFHTTPPTALYDGKIDTREGCASIADAAGQVLFYTNGVSVWNRLHDTMPGGANIEGGRSSTQSALIIPNPNRPEIYYIFTTGEKERFFENGLRYSTVDMSSNNGHGKVQEAGVLLQNDVAEKITAVAHANNRDTWVLVHSMYTNKFLAFLVTPFGVEPTPVISAVGDPYLNDDEGLGAMKASLAGNRIAVANFGQHTLSVYPFDNTTGILSSVGSVVVPELPFCYGIEFSPDGNNVYCSTYKHPYRLYQFDITTSDIDKVRASAVVLNADKNQSLASLQLAPDGKIYIAKEGDSALGIIEYPNRLGTSCTYRPQGINIVPRRSALGLPSFALTPTFLKPITIEGPTSVCPFSTNVSYSVRTLLPNNEECFWMHKSKGSIMQLPPSKTLTLNFTTSGIDTLIAWCRTTNDCFSPSDTFLISVLPVPVSLLGGDRVLCPKKPLLLDAGAGFRSYLWQNGSTAQTLHVTAPGLYSITVENALGCFINDTISVYEPPTIALSLGNDTLLCRDGSLTLRATAGFQRYKWQNGSTEATLVVSAPGLYWIETEDICGAVLYDTVAVTYRTNTQWSVGGSATVCPGESALLFARGAVAYQWSPTRGLDNPTDAHPVATPSATTTYTVTGTDAYGCRYTDSVTVIVKSVFPVTFTLPTITAPPRTTALPIPVRVTMHPQALPLEIDTLRMTLRFRSALLRITHSFHGTWATHRDGQWEELTILIPNIVITTPDTTITTLMGDVFLGDMLSTPLLLSSIVTDACHTPIERHGTLSLDSNSLCQLSLRQVRMRDFHPTKLHIAPNPTRSAPTLAVTTAEEGIHNIGLYNLQGILVWNTSFVHSGAVSMREIPVPIGVLHTEIYTVALKTPSQFITHMLLVQQ